MKTSHENSFGQVTKFHLCNDFCIFIFEDILVFCAVNGKLFQFVPIAKKKLN